MNIARPAGRFGFVLVAFATLSCAPKELLQPQDWAFEAQTAESREAHQRLADHYNEVAQTLLTQADEVQRILRGYLAAPHKYGKRFNDLKAHAQAEIRDLDMAADESRQLAEYHRQLARELP